MNKVQIRDALVARMQDTWVHTNVPVFYENLDDIDLDKVGDEFVTFRVEWIAKKQITISQSPIFRNYGRIVIILFGKEGTGTRDRLLLDDELSETFKAQYLGGIQIQVPGPGRPEGHDGWDAPSIYVPFFADSNS